MTDYTSRLLREVSLPRFRRVGEEKSGTLYEGERDKKLHCKSRKREHVSNAHPQT
jgi:hypothetical protein